MYKQVSVESSFTIEVDDLIKPISQEMATGQDLRQVNAEGSLYYKIKEARNRARAKERRLMQGFEDLGISPVEDWKQVCEIATEILLKYSKDLEICAWFIEASLRILQFEGLKKAFCVTRQLCEKYWDSLHPVPTDQDISMKVAPIAGLNGEETEGTLIVPISSTYIIDANDAGRFALWQYKQAVEISKITDQDKKSKYLSEAGIDLKNVESAINKTSPEFFSNLILNLEGCITESASLYEFLDSHCGQEAPPCSRIQEGLKTCLDTVKFISKEVLSSAALKNLIAVDSSQRQDSPQRMQDIQKPQSREAALSKLSEIAQFFKETEPHSPLSYLIEKVVRWGKMPLPQLLSELITDANTRTTVFELTGIPQEPQST